MAYELSSWDLSKIKPKDIEKTISDIDNQVTKLEKFREKLNEEVNEKDFLEYLKQLEELETKTSKLYAYLGLKYSENTADHEVSALKTRIEQFLTNIGNRLIFFGLWFKDLNDKKAKELISLKTEYKYFLESIRKTKPFALKESEEQIINIKDVSGANALTSVYNILTSQFEYEMDGKTYNQNELRRFVYDPDPEVRKKAYISLFSKYEQYKDVISEIYKQTLNDWREENVNLRGYKSPISVRNISNDLPDEAVDALLNVCEKNQGIFHKFFSLKQKELGLKQFTRFDLYSTLEKEKSEISYDEGLKLVLDTFGEFSTEFKSAAEQVVDANHIHSVIQKNKNPGAYCWGVTKTELPFVLLNYAGTLRDVSTLAHELGHVVHDVLAQKNTEFTHHPCLPLAETASTFAELILLEKLVKKNPEKVKSLLFSQLDNYYATIIRQATFTQFEKQAHQMISEGKHLQDVNQMYLGLIKKQLGSDVTVDEMFGQEWLYVPHFYHTPFYCYAYSFGNLFALSLYETYKEEGDSFVPKLLDMLSKGGSESPIDLTKALDVDINSEEFWQKGFDVIKNMVEELSK